MNRALALSLAAMLAACAPRVPSGSREGLIGEGAASYYGASLHGRPTANGERYDRGGLTAAHRKLPFGACVLVLNVENGRSVQVRVNDRGPYARGRLIDVSEAAARALGMMRQGVARVRLSRC